MPKGRTPAPAGSQGAHDGDGAGRRRGRRWTRQIVAGLLIAAGLGLAVPGVWLVTLGGSAYYAVAGVATVASGVLLLRGAAEGLALFAAMLGATIGWSLAEVGFDGWALMPRLVFWIVAGLLVALPPVWHGTRPASISPRLMGRAVAAFVLSSAMIGVAVRPDATPEPRGIAADQVAAVRYSDGEWPAYGNRAGGTRFSPLTEITPANVASLRPAWTFRPGDRLPGTERTGGLQMTPLMVDGLVYGCTAFSSVFALDPTTGRQVWRHHPGVDPESGGHPACRGVAFHRAPAGIRDCPTRILIGTVDNRLIALDAKTGARCPGFGRDGAVDLTIGMGDFPKRWFHPTSPPTIVRGTAVIGHYVVDNQQTDVPPGVVRGYDAVTGALRWAFDPARSGITAPPPPGGTYTPSTPNSWSIASGDEALGIVYLPMGNGSPDFYGRGRNGGDAARLATSVVALDARTGRVRWSFQIVHHDLWDYDAAAQPVLADFPTAGGPVPALILATKTGQIFVLDRRSGRPLTKVVERPVPASDLPGETASPTQPFSVGMPDMAGAPLAERDMWGLTPFDQLQCRIRFRQARYAGPFTPPRLGDTIRYPGELGGIDWGSVSVDERRGLLLVNSNHMADRDRLITRAEADRAGIVVRSSPRIHSAPGAAMGGTPYAVVWGPFLSSLDVPCQRPPFGYLTAIDLRSRAIVWRRPLGDARNSGPFGLALGLPLPLGAPNIGGSITTASGLVFVAATQDEMFRAIDTRTGRVLWQTKLPAGGHATPMTYLGPDRRQYVLIAAGGRSLRDPPGDHLIAFRL